MTIFNWSIVKLLSSTEDKADRLRLLAINAISESFAVSQIENQKWLYPRTQRQIAHR